MSETDLGPFMLSQTPDNGRCRYAPYFFGLLFLGAGPSVAFGAPPGDPHLDQQSSLSSQTHRITGVNRVGLIRLTHNLEQYRRASSSRAVRLVGLPGAPIQGEALDFRLKELLRQASEIQGRFLLVETGSRAGGQPGAERARLASKHDLDAWLEVSVGFFPDHARVEISLLDRQANGLQVLQSLDLEADPDQKTLTEALAQVLARVGQATGHLSEVSWQSRDLVTIDLGGRALRTGEKLHLGEISAQRMHPSTGEILSVTKRPLYEAEVLEVNAFSSLARVTSILDEQLSRSRAESDSQRAGSTAASLQGPSLVGLLVWRPAQDEVLQDANRLADAVQSGQAVEGFPQAAKPPAAPAAQTSPTVSQTSPGASESETAPRQDAIPATPDKNVEEVASEEESSFIPESMSQFAEGFMPDLAWSAALSDPTSWQPRAYTLGAGQSYGIVDTTPCANTPCSRYSGFPTILINLVSFNADYRLTQSSGLRFEGRFANYPEGDVEGYEIGARAFSLHRVGRMSRGVFDFYFGPELEIGAVNTVLLKRSLLAFSVRTGLGAEGPTPFGDYQADFDLSLLEFLRGKFALDMRLGWAKVPVMPEELSFFTKSRRSLKGWTQLEVGAAWSFKPNPRRMPGGGTLGLPSW